MSDQEMAKIFYDYGLAELTAYCEARGWPRFRAAQILEWQAKSVMSAGAMTNLSLAMRDSLAGDMIWPPVQVVDRECSAVEAVNKYLLELPDGQRIETVSMSYDYGRTVCLTTQAGCRMGCAFCASARAGFARQLSAGEMLAQIACIEHEEKQKVSHLVLMGIGEPLDNFAEVSRLLHRLGEPHGIRIGMRRITLSTCGLVPEIDRLADEELPVTLAISLHAADQKLRERLMPAAKRYSIKEIVAAADRYFQRTGRRVTYEYALFAGVNDQLDQAAQLAALLRGKPVHVNLIPANPVPGSDFKRTSAEAAEAFRACLVRHGIQATVRRSAGGDITAACGQLRREKRR